MLMAMVRVENGFSSTDIHYLDAIAFSTRGRVNLYHIVVPTVHSIQ